MKTEIKTFFLVGSLIMGLASCEQNDFVNIDENQEIQTKSVVENDVETFNLHAIYKDQHYYSKCEIRNDSIFVLDNKLAALQDSLEKLPEFTVLRVQSGVEEYFDSREDFLAKYGVRDLKEQDMTAGVDRSNMASSRAVKIANARLFDDTNAGGKVLDLDIVSDPYKVISYPKLKDQGMNDKTSCLVVNYNYSDPDACSLLCVWENSNYNQNDMETTKHFTYFMANINNHTHWEWNLKQVKCYNAHDSWNDRISSCKLYIGYLDQLPKIY